MESDESDVNMTRFDFRVAIDRKAILEQKSNPESYPSRCCPMLFHFSAFHSLEGKKPPINSDRLPFLNAKQ
jgi:hypothetical protein